MFELSWTSEVFSVSRLQEAGVLRPPQLRFVTLLNPLQSYEKFLKLPNILPIIFTDFQKNIHFSLNQHIHPDFHRFLFFQGAKNLSKFPDSLA